MIILPIKVNLEHLNIHSYIRRQIKGIYFILDLNYDITQRDTVL